MAIGTTAAVILGGAAAGAGAIAASGAKSAADTQAEAQRQALSAQEKAAAEAKERRNEAVRLKQEAAKNIHFPTFLETPEAQQFKQTLEDRMAGRGLIDVEAGTSPVAAQVRSGLEQTKAAIGSGASARGLGRSTVATSQIGEASKAAERDIASRMQQLELAKQEQIGQAVSQFGTVAEAEAISKQNKARFQQGAEFNIADTIANDANQTRNDQFAISNTIAQNGANAASWQLLNSQIWSSGILAAGKSYASGIGGASDEIVGKLNSKLASRGAQVNIGNSRLASNRLVTSDLSLGGF